MWGVRFLLLVSPLVSGKISTILRIVGGRPVAISQVPYQLSLHYYGSFICGAALISRDVAISAGHCFKRPGPYSVRAGSAHLNKDGFVVHIIKVVVHPRYGKYGNSNDDYDVALLFLQSPLSLGDVIRPVQLPNSEETIPPKGTLGTVVGWGIQSSDADMPSMEVRAVQLPVYEWEECHRLYADSAVTVRQFCAGYSDGGRDACQGDSGGPFVVNNTIYGIVSLGFGCALAGFPGIYTNVIKMRNFIRENSGL